MNVTVTMYLIVQGIVPSIFGENIGRRPIYLAVFIVYFIASVGLGIQNSYGAHPQLDRIRCVQLCQYFNPLRTKSDGVAKSSSTTAKANYVILSHDRTCAVGRWGVGAFGWWE